MTLKAALILLGYFALFVGSVAALLWWQRRQRRRRLPFGDDMRLLRGPGESQMRLLRQLDEDEPWSVALAATAPAVVGFALLWVTTLLPGVMQWGGLAVAVVGFTGAILLAARWYAGRTREYQDRYLGYFGERIVAEHLEPLKAQGWRVFHDVPMVSNGARFNLDHVAVGPGGVFAIETKTRRKGGARPGFDDYKVYFDGTELVWPWGEDSHGLTQAESEAKRLAAELPEENGRRVNVVPVLALPGWWVEYKPARAARPCRVFNPKVLANRLAQEPAVLSERQIEAIAAWLDARCRDVAY